MQKINLVYGTVYGSAQYVAETFATEFAERNMEHQLWQPNELVGWQPAEDELLIVVCATTGNGDLPDDILPWFTELKDKAPYLPNLQYALVGLGDSSYEHFCGAIIQFEELLQELGAKPLYQTLKIDACETMEPEVDAKVWLDGIVPA
ncbi:flavodoxin [Shewanella marina]|uniref:flavodoxin n=1 Tax=Shewanella marina TaxID=487319 RepID=UPI00046EA529|nr:flavodoxin [Shewanella marina]